MKYATGKLFVGPIRHGIEKFYFDSRLFFPSFVHVVSLLSIAVIDLVINEF